MYCSYAFNAIQKTKTLTFLLAYTAMIVDETSDTVLMNLCMNVMYVCSYVVASKICKMIRKPIKGKK